MYARHLTSPLHLMERPKAGNVVITHAFISMRVILLVWTVLSHLRFKYDVLKLYALGSLMCIMSKTVPSSCTLVPSLEHI